MSKTDILLLAVIILNLALFSISTIIMQRFKDFKDISELFKDLHKGDQRFYKLIIDEYNSMQGINQLQMNAYKIMNASYEAMSEQYKKISEINHSYRELCKECIDRYGDAYDQFKICSEKLDKIFTPPPCGCECHADDTQIGGSHDD